MLTLKVEHRSNGLTYVDVMSGGQVAGSFSLPTVDYLGQVKKEALTLKVSEVSGAPVTS